jgi:hypothetical protein
MNDFILGIFRVADSLDTSKLNQSAAEHRYIALVPATHHSKSSWYSSETLFGLEKQMKDHRIIDWAHVEKEVATKGFYKYFDGPSEEEKAAMKEARMQSA